MANGTIALPAPPAGVSRDTMWAKLLKVDKSLATTRSNQRKNGTAVAKFGNPMSFGELMLSMGMAAGWGALFRAKPDWREFFGAPGQVGLDARVAIGGTTLLLSLWKPTRKFIPKMLQVSVPMSTLLPYAYDTGGDVYTALAA